jgi:uncharacterized repeat protein (TIGR02543 family)
MPSGNATLKRWAIILEQDIAPPAITGLVATVLSGNSTVIEWQTDEPADSHVSYGTAPGSYSMEASESTLVTDHAVTLTGLMPGTTYYFKVSSSDSAGNTAQSPEDSFTTESEEVQYTLTVAANDQGTVLKDPDKPFYESGEVVTLTASPYNGYQFTSWSGDASGTTNPIQITMDDNKSIAANFTPVEAETYNLDTVALDGGAIIRNPDKPIYQSGEVVTLTADPDDGYEFTGWSGDANGEANPVQIIMTSDKYVVATFEWLDPGASHYLFIPSVLE